MVTEYVREGCAHAGKCAHSDRYAAVGIGIVAAGTLITRKLTSVGGPPI